MVTGTHRAFRLMFAGRLGMAKALARIALYGTLVFFRSLSCSKFTLKANLMEYCSVSRFWVRQADEDGGEWFAYSNGVGVRPSD